MKIIAVGWNYVEHNRELGHGLPSEPVIFSKPDSALLKGNKPFFLPDFSQKDEHSLLKLVAGVSARRSRRPAGPGWWSGCRPGGPGA